MATQQRKAKVDIKSEVTSEPRMTRSRKKRQLTEQDANHQTPKIAISVKKESSPEENNSELSHPSKPKYKRVSKKSSGLTEQRTGKTARQSEAKSRDQKVKIKESVNTVTTADKKPTSKKVKQEERPDSQGTSDEMAGFVVKGGKFVGAHTSAAGGLWNAVSGALEIKGRAFALFLKSQRQWKAKSLEEDVVDKFQSALKTSGYHPDFILPHGSYLLNCGSPNPETLEKSRACLLDEVQRCQRLGLNRYNFHPGSTCGEIPVDECLDLIGESINTVLNETSQVTIVVENMSCQGNTVGGKFEELKGIIDRVKDKSRIGVCLDTCHAFAAGYDLSTEDGYNKMTDEFDKLVGFQYLKGVHLNDSKGKVGCHLDRHENIGKGFIGLDGFRRLMNDKRFDGVPMILETPPGLTDAEEIELLYDMVD